MGLMTRDSERVEARVRAMLEDHADFSNGHHYFPGTDEDSTDFVDFTERQEEMIVVLLARAYAEGGDVMREQMLTPELHLSTKEAF